MWDDWISISRNTELEFLSFTFWVFIYKQIKEHQINISINWSLVCVLMKLHIFFTIYQL